MESWLLPTEINPLSQKSNIEGEKKLQYIFCRYKTRVKSWRGFTFFPLPPSLLWFRTHDAHTLYTHLVRHGRAIPSVAACASRAAGGGRPARARAGPAVGRIPRHRHVRRSGVRRLRRVARDHRRNGVHRDNVVAVADVQEDDLRAMKGRGGQGGAHDVAVANGARWPLHEIRVTPRTRQNRQPCCPNRRARGQRCDAPP